MYNVSSNHSNTAPLTGPKVACILVLHICNVYFKQHLHMHTCTTTIMCVCSRNNRSKLSHVASLIHNHLTCEYALPMLLQQAHYFIHLFLHYKYVVIIIMLTFENQFMTRVIEGFYLHCSTTLQWRAIRPTQDLSIATEHSTAASKLSLHAFIVQKAAIFTHQLKTHLR